MANYLVVSRERQCQGIGTACSLATCAPHCNLPASASPLPPPFPPLLPSHASLSSSPLHHFTHTRALPSLTQT